MSKLQQISVFDEINLVIKEKGIEYREDGGKNYIFKICPFCGDDHFHFYLGIAPNNLGLWNCFKCSGGSTQNKVWDSLKERLVGEENYIITAPMKQQQSDKNNYIPKILQYHNDLMADQETLNYLINERKINIDTIQKYKLGKVTMQPQKWNEPTNFLCIPHFYKHALMNAKFRSLPPAKKGFVRIVDGASILFNYDNIDITKDYIFVCEGEIDTLTLAQAGETNVVGITVGAQSFNPDWYDLLRAFKVIYLVLDNDHAGQEGAKMIANRLGIDKCYNVLLPQRNGTDSSIKDVNSYFNHFDIEDFKSVVLKATRFVTKTLYTVDSVITELENRMLSTGTIIEGLDTPWGKLNAKLGPIAKGDLVYLSGKPKRGKTSFALNLCHYYAYEKGIPSLLFCLEMMPERLATKLVCYHRKVEYKNLTVDDLQMTRSDFNYKNAPFYFGYTADPKYLNPDALFNIFELVHRKYGIEFFVFDNLQFLVRSISNVAQETAKISRQFKLMAMNLNCQVMVIVQPKRMADDQVMTSSHLKDSSAMEADADHVLITHRKDYAEMLVNTGGIDNRETLSPIVVVTIDRSRYGPGGATSLYLEGAKSYLREATDEEVLAN